MKYGGIMLKAAAGAGILLLAYYLNRTGLLQRLLETLDQMGPAAPWAFLAVYILTCIFFVPSLVFCFAGGVLFGLWKGIVLTVLGAGIGSTCAFLIGRTLARRPVEKAFASSREFQSLNRAVKQKGWKIVLLARLSPVFPFSVGNYAFGLTGIPALAYGFASIVGTTPSNSVYVYAGTLAGSLGAVQADGRERSLAEWALLLLGLAATVALTLYLKRVAKEALVGHSTGSLRDGFPAKE